MVSQNPAALEASASAPAAEVSPRRRRFPLSPLGRLALGLALAAAAGCGGATGENGDAGGAAAGMPAIPVEIVTLVPTPVEQVSEFVGTVKSRRAMTLQPQVEGFVTRIHVASGDRVEAGSPIVEIDDGPQRAIVASLRSLRVAREAEATFARQQAERQQSLFEAGAASRQELDRAEAELKNAEAQLAAANEEVREQEKKLAYYRVVAPMSGIVGDIPVREGDRVTTAAVVTTIDAEGGLEVYVGVPVQLVPRLRPDLPVRLLSESGEPVAETRISFVAPSVDDATQTVLVKAPAPENAHLRAGQFVRSRIVWSAEPSLTVPVVSVIRVSGQMFAFTAVSDGQDGLVTSQRPISVGPVVGDDYVVTEGLQAGDRLIVSGLQKIRDGAPVRPAVPAADEGAEGPEVR